MQGTKVGIPQKLQRAYDGDQHVQRDQCQHAYSL